MSKLKSLGPLGVSPASGYGFVAGSGGARFFGEGTINPKFFAWHAFFQIRPGSFQNGVMQKYFVGPKDCFIYGSTVGVTGLDEEQSPMGTKTYVYIECEVSDAAITSAEIKGYDEIKPLFEPEEELAEQTKVRHFLGIVIRQRPFAKFGHNLIYPIIQSSFSVPIAIPACVNGYRGVLITTA
jgi:hypothetical protein